MSLVSAISSSDTVYWVNNGFLIAAGALTTVSFIVQAMKPARYGKFARPDVKDPYAKAETLSSPQNRDSEQTLSAGPSETAAEPTAVGTQSSDNSTGFPARLSFLISDGVGVLPLWAVIWVVYTNHYLDGTYRATSIVFFIAWSLHFIHRGLIHPFVMRYSAKNVGWDIFAPMVPTNMIFTYINAAWLGTTLYDTDYPASPRFIIGLVLFVYGFHLNRWADWKLRSLRKENDRAYYVPHGYMFELVSCPGYLGELIEWGGFAIGVWNLAALVWLLFCCSTFFPRARNNHDFYLHNFPDYPKNRKRLIPFIY